MQHDYTDAQKELELIQKLFQNKQLDQFIYRVEHHVIPYLDKKNHLVSDHLIDKQQMLLKDNLNGKLEKELNDFKIDPLQKLKQKPQIQQLPTHYQNHPNQQNQKTHQNGLELAKQQAASKSPNSHPETLTKSQQMTTALMQSKFNILEKYEEMKLILFKIEREMQKLSTPMIDKGEWKVNKINSTSVIGVKTKGTLVEIRYEGIVETNIFNLCVMIYLSELWKEWVPFCTGSKNIAQPSPLQKVVLMDLKIPFLTERYSYLHGIAVDRITKNGKLYIYAEGITSEKDLLINVHKVDKNQYEKKVSKSVVLDAKYMVAEIGNQGNGKYSVKVYGMLDSHMPLLPQKVVNYIVKQLGGMIFEKIVQKAKDIKNTPWEKELKQNQKRQVKNMFYDWLDQRIKNWDKTQTARKSKI